MLCCRELVIIITDMAITRISGDITNSMRNYNHQCLAKARQIQNILNSDSEEIKKLIRCVTAVWQKTQFAVEGTWNGTAGSAPPGFLKMSVLCKGWPDILHCPLNAPKFVSSCC